LTFSIGYRDGYGDVLGMAMRADPAYLGSAHIRPAQRGLARPAPTPYTLCGLQTLPCPAPHLARGPDESGPNCHP